MTNAHFFNYHVLTNSNESIELNHFFAPNMLIETLQAGKNEKLPHIISLAGFNPGDVQFFSANSMMINESMIAIGNGVLRITFNNLGVQVVYFVTLDSFITLKVNEL